MTFRLLITGSRDWEDRLVVAEAIIDLKNDYPIDWDDLVIVHGGCPTGADAIAEDFARSSGIKTEVHKASWDIFGKKAGPIKNQEMVDLGADICLAFIGPKSKGARGCAKMAEKAGIDTKRIEMEY